MDRGSFFGVMPPPVSAIILKPGTVQPVWAGHPWVFPQAVERIEGGAVAGAEIDVLDGRGNYLGRALYSPSSAIVARIYSRTSTRLDRQWFAEQLARALERRKELGLPNERTNAFRAVHAEGDDLPGLVVDLFDRTAVVQLGTIGLKQREGLLLELIEEVFGATTIIDRSSPAAARAEGFEPGVGIVRGSSELSELRFRELGIDYRVPLELGQKTGFYLDQRPLRARVRRLAERRRVLDTFCYVGSLAMAAAAGGAASVRAVDTSALALEVAASSVAANGLQGRVELVREDAREALTRAGRQGGYDLVICDPPKLAPTRASSRRALATMRQLAALGCRATRAGGLLALSSCSAAIGLNELTRSLAVGGRDVHVRPVVIERIFQGADHPVPAAFPEGLYLSTVIARIHPL